MVVKRCPNEAVSGRHVYRPGKEPVRLEAGEVGPGQRQEFCADGYPRQGTFAVGATPKGIAEFIEKNQHQL